MPRIVPMVLAALLLAASPATAQDKAVHFTVGGGYTFALSDVRNHLGDGYNLNVGLTFDVAPTVSVQAEYGYTGLGDKSLTVPAPLAADSPTIFTGSMDMHHGDVNLIFGSHARGRANPYFLAGLGVYHRTVKVTTPGIGYVPGYCDPWWYICYPGGVVPVDKVLGSRSSTDFGMNFGGGVDVKLGESSSFYFEVRYHYIWGPEAKDGNGKSYGKANGQFMPLTFGFRF
jgi:opacity protein-like surface antigen